MPALCSLALKLLLIVLTSGQVRLDRPLYVGGTDDVLQYDDGTAIWVTWAGVYRGVWFDVDDFGASPGVILGQIELWFYHYTPYYTWDTGSFYLELWAGSSNGPEMLLDQTSVTALHKTALHVGYPTPIWCGSTFWIVENTLLSSGGWPSILGDNSPNTTDHSFSSDDFLIWDPWIIGYPYIHASDFLFRAHGSETSLDRRSWASVKTLFQTSTYDRAVSAAGNPEGQGPQE